MRSSYFALSRSRGSRNKMMNGRWCRNTSILRVLFCALLGCTLLLARRIPQYSQSSTCLPVNSDGEILNHQDEWKYQNTITGQWYFWTMAYPKQHHRHKWTVKWLNAPPASSLGVIVYLTTRHELGSLNQSLLQLSRLLVNNPRPVVIFHEGDFADNDIQQSLARTLGSRTPLAFERIQFTDRSNRFENLKQFAHDGYRHMCRFFTLMLPNHPLLRLFTFYWRMDAHSYIFAPRPIADPFEIMQQRHIQYAYIMANNEGEDYVVGLWSFFQQFLSQHCLKPSAAVRQTQTKLFGGYSLAMIFTNFAIANVSLFRDHSLIRAWLHAVDRNGGTYRHRWGDAPVHTLALTQFLPRHDIVRFRYFGYMHRREYVCASGTEDIRCKKEVEPFLTNPHIKYLNYDDGCWPSYRNLLCHYYPQITS